MIGLEITPPILALSLEVMLLTLVKHYKGANSVYSLIIRIRCLSWCLSTISLFSAITRASTCMSDDLDGPWDFSKLPRSA